MTKFEFWNYVEEPMTGMIYYINNPNVLFKPLSEIVKYNKKEFIKYNNQLINIIVNSDHYQNKVCMINYIYYITFNYNNILQSKEWKIWKNILILRLRYFIKKEYFEFRIINYKNMKDFKQIYYLLTGVYICEYINCNRDCCDKKKTLCSIHLRKNEKQAKHIEHITNIPLYVCKLITDY